MQRILLYKRNYNQFFVGGGGLVSIHNRTINSVCENAHNREGRFAAREASEIFTVLVCHQSVTCHTNMLDFTAGAITCSEGMYYEGTGFFKAEVPGWFCAMTSRHGCT